MDNKTSFVEKANSRDFNYFIQLYINEEAEGVIPETRAEIVAKLLGYYHEGAHIDPIDDEVVAQTVKEFMSHVQQLETTLSWTKEEFIDYLVNKVVVNNAHSFKSMFNTPEDATACLEKVVADYDALFFKVVAKEEKESKSEEVEKVEIENKLLPQDGAANETLIAEPLQINDFNVVHNFVPKPELIQKAEVEKPENKLNVATIPLQAKDILLADEFSGSSPLSRINTYNSQSKMKMANPSPEYKEGKIVFPKEIQDINKVIMSFQIQRLDKVTQFIEDDLYSSRDFVVLPQEKETGKMITDGRINVKLKMGNLFIDYSTGGKGSCDAEVFYINKKWQYLKLIIPFSQYRYSENKSEILLPFSLSSFYLGRTGQIVFCHRAMAKNAMEMSLCTIRETLVYLALGKHLADFPMLEAECQIVRAELTRYHRKVAPPIKVSEAKSTLFGAATSSVDTPLSQKQDFKPPR